MTIIFFSASTLPFLSCLPLKAFIGSLPVTMCLSDRKQNFASPNFSQ